MRKFDIGLENDGPITHQRTFQDSKTRQERTIEGEFHLRVYGDVGEKTVAIISDTPDNFKPDRMPVSAFLAEVVHKLKQDLGIKSLEDIEVIHHQPENVRGLNPERHQRVNFYYDLNGIHEGYGMNARLDLTPDQVAEKIGPENFQDRYATQPAQGVEIPEPDALQWGNFAVEQESASKQLAAEYAATHPEPDDEPIP